jgi:hypothetical protein
VATSIYAAWGTRLAPAVFADDFAGTGIGSPGDDNATKALLHILEDIDSTDAGFVVHTKGANGESALWDDKTTPAVETRDEILLRSLADALVFLKDVFGSDQPPDWLWGGIHRVAFQHFFGQAGIQSFNIGNIPAPGSRFCVNPAHFSFNATSAANFVFSDGPSERFVAVLDPAGVRSVNIVPTGENGNPCAGPATPAGCGLNPVSYNHINPGNHYGEHIPGWVNGEVFEYRVSRDAVAADTQELIEFRPAIILPRRRGDAEDWLVCGPLGGALRASAVRIFSHLPGSSAALRDASETLVEPRAVEHDFAVVNAVHGKQRHDEVAGVLDVDDDLLAARRCDLAHRAEFLAAFLEVHLVADLDGADLLFHTSLSAGAAPSVSARHGLE